MPYHRHRQSSRGLVSGVALAVVVASWTAGAARAADRSAVFDANCSMCHQLGAAGVPGQFPRLAGRVGRIAATAAGRAYLERVVLYGMIGAVTVDGTPIAGGVMPSFSSLSDRDLAAALNYVASLDATGKLHWKGPVFAPAELARVRSRKALSPIEVHRLRAAALGRGKS